MSTTGLGVGNQLTTLLDSNEIQPGSEPSYQLCKIIYTHHPLGGKMVDAPISMAQSQSRELTIQDAPEEVLEEFEKEWGLIGADSHIANVTRLSRIYGIAALIVGCEQVDSDKPLDMTKIWDQQIYFNALDPLNTAGSLVLNQVSTSPDFNKPVTVATSGQVFHRSRYQVVMNEAPIYLSYTSSAFGFVGRSVYQRALFPLKSFIRTMVADDMIAQKLALIVAKMVSPGSLVDKIMEKIANFKRALLKAARNGNIMSIDIKEDIETLDMQNVDGAGRYARGNILKNIATAADMPAVLLENETLTEGFGEGTEDAKTVARYVDKIRIGMQPVYAWFDNIVQHRAWNEVFYARMQEKYPEQYAGRDYRDAFTEWRRNFKAVWPSLLIEPESEAIKTEDVKLQAVIATLQTLLPQVDPESKALLIQSALANISENKQMFAHEFEIAPDALRDHLIEQEEHEKEMQLAAAQNPGGAEGEEKPANGVAAKFGKFDSAGGVGSLRAAVARLPAHKSGHRPAAP
jgi:hypothetical protein